ncbi:MAG: glycosyltransferase [Ghiorsea sp.]|nr:glycosyltransferase [Ghiorsea sp.]
MSPAYKQLTNGAAQADLWRMFVLWKEGGVYMDIDAHLVWPLAWLIKPEDDELFLINKQHYTNYLIAAAPNHPILKETIDIIVDNIQNRRVEQKNALDILRKVIASLDEKIRFALLDMLTTFLPLRSGGASFQITGIYQQGVLEKLLDS